MAAATWNPQYERYAEIHGRSPESQLEHDRKRWPGGCMCGYILWISQVRAAYYAETGDGAEIIWDRDRHHRFVMSYKHRLRGVRQ